MNHLDIAKKEGRERFDKLIDSLPSRVNETPRSVILSFILSHERTIEVALLKDLVEEAEEMKKKIYDNWTATNDRDEERFSILSREEKGFNSALATLITKYQERINKLL